jgi:hypothetical protein
MHPINDPNWWKGAATDSTPNETGGKTKGGWHNDYAKIPGRWAKTNARPVTVTTIWEPAYPKRR